MTITTCPKCGSFNVTTAGVCENCGWSQFAQVALCTRITGEMELKVSGKALLDDYKRLLFENRNLTARIAELEKDNTEFRQLIRDWSIVLEQDEYFQLWHVESVRQAMLEINKERE